VGARAVRAGRLQRRNVEVESGASGGALVTGVSRDALGLGQHLSADQEIVPTSLEISVLDEPPLDAPSTPLLEAPSPTAPLPSSPSAACSEPVLIQQVLRKWEVR